MEYLHPDNLAFRTTTNWKLGFAYHLKGDRAAAGRFYTEVIATGQASGNLIFTIMATIGLGHLQEIREPTRRLAARLLRRGTLWGSLVADGWGCLSWFSADRV